MKPRAVRLSLFLLLLSFSYFAGSAAGYLLSSPSASPPFAAVSAEGNWGLSFPQEGKPPVANASAEYLSRFHAYYAQDTEEKVLYPDYPSKPIGKAGACPDAADSKGEPGRGVAEE